MKYYLLYMTSLLLFLSSCTNGEALNKELALKELEIKIEQYRSRKMEDCRAEAIKSAEIIVDSIIRTSTFAPIKNQKYNPTIPVKPNYVPVDSSVFKSKNSVKPISQSF